MKTLWLGLLLLVACSKSSAKPSPEQHAAPAPAPVVVEAAETAESADCDNACTALAQCFEIVNPGSNFRDGGPCTDHCNQRPAAEQKAFAKEAAEALRTKHCEKLFPEEGESVEGEEDEVVENVEKFEKLDPALRPGKPLKLNGASFELTSKQTQPGGDNQAPTFDDRVVVTCHNKPIELFHEEAEGMTTTTTLKALDSTHVLVQFAVHIAREGESSREEHALRFDTATCAVVK